MPKTLGFSWLLFTGLPLLGCPTSGFECGVSLDDDTVARCTVGSQVCICDTRSCAERVPASQCASGYRYVERPFADEDVAERCVPSESQGWIVTQEAENPYCGSAPPDAGTAGNGGAS